MGMEGRQVNEFVQKPEFETLLQLCFTLFWRTELACRFGEGRNKYSDLIQVTNTRFNQILPCPKISPE